MTQVNIIQKSICNSLGWYLTPIFLCYIPRPLICLHKINIQSDCCSVCGYCDNMIFEVILLKALVFLLLIVWRESTALRHILCEWCSSHILLSKRCPGMILINLDDRYIYCKTIHVSNMWFLSCSLLVNTIGIPVRLIGNHYRTRCINSGDEVAATLQATSAWGMVVVQKYQSGWWSRAVAGHFGLGWSSCGPEVSASLEAYSET